MAVCLAVIGKENAPLYIYTADAASELQFHYVVHTALDVVEEKLANYKRPKQIVFLNALPRNSMGKVQKAQLRETYAELYGALEI